jgi:hypothetical protein
MGYYKPNINLFILLFGIILFGIVLEGYSQSLVKSQDMSDTQDALMRTLISEISMDLEMVKEEERRVDIGDGETAQMIEYSGEYNSEYLFKSTVTRVVNSYTDVDFLDGFERTEHGIAVTMLVTLNGGKLGMVYMSFTGADGSKQWVTATY